MSAYCLTCDRSPCNCDEQRAEECNETALMAVGSTALFCESCAHWSPCNLVDGVCEISQSLPTDVPQGWLTEKTFGCVRHSQNDPR